MTNAAVVQPPFPPTWPLEELFSYLLANLNVGDTKDAIEVLDNIGTRGAEEALQALAVMEKGAGIEPSSPKARLAFYLNMPATAQDSTMRLRQTILANQNAVALGQPQTPLPVDLSWQEYAAKLPQEYEASWADFQQLKAKDAAGEL